MIAIENLSKSYGDTHVLKNINIRIEDGDIFGLVGESGVGKSTLLGCLNGLENYQAGRVMVDDVQIDKLSEKELRVFRKKMGMIFQNFSLVQRKSVFKNIAMPMECWGVPKNEIEEKVHELAELVGIEDKLNSRPAQLSGGQKQRVAIARALTMDPRYLLCDECTSALDPKMTLSILELLADIREKMGITIVMVTHEMSVVQQVCDKIAVLDQGEVALTGNVSELFMKKPIQLKKFLGMDQEQAYEGRNISLLLDSNRSDTPFLCDLYEKTHVPFNLVDSQFFDFRGEKRCSIVVNVSDENLDTVCRYLRGLEIDYQIEEKGEQRVI